MMTDADVVSTTVYIESENEPEIDLSGKCPGDTTLIDYVRRKVQRKLGLRLMQHDRQTVLQMIRTGNCNWTSTVDEFKVCCATLITNNSSSINQLLNQPNRSDI